MMLLITYDRNRADQDYSGLHKEVKKASKWASGGTTWSPRGSFARISRLLSGLTDSSGTWITLTTSWSSSLLRTTMAGFQRGLGTGCASKTLP